MVRKTLIERLKYKKYEGQIENVVYDCQDYDGKLYLNTYLLLTNGVYVPLRSYGKRTPNKVKALKENGVIFIHDAEKALELKYRK